MAVSEQPGSHAGGRVTPWLNLKPETDLESLPRVGRSESYPTWRAKVAAADSDGESNSD